ncbi:glomulin-like [Osmerus eperlanus]|uniref:glomulin-like n=1 Tax=Osmerus eperlanus TaxID=29151 RepID=UPI002E144268
MVIMTENQFHDVIQRWRDTPDDSLKPEDHELFQNVGSTFIAQGDSAQMLNFIQDDKNQKIVRSMGCGLLGVLVNETQRKNNSDCQIIMTHLTKTCRPKEVLFALLEPLKDIHPDAIADTVTVVTPHLQTALLRLGEDKAPSVGLSLSALHKQVSRLPVPYTPQQETDDAYGLCRCCAALTAFLRPFVEEVRRGDGASSRGDGLRTELLKFCMESLREPLLQAQLDQATTERSPMWVYARDTLVTLMAVQESLPDLLFYGSLRKNLAADDTREVQARACLAYLIFVQFISIESFPAVFSPVFVLQCNMEYINLLLSRKDESWLLKGLALYAKSLELVENRSLPVELLELNTFYTVPQNLVQILTDCPIKHLRERGLKVFQLFIDKLDVEAKHKFFRCILKTTHHAGVEGYVIKNIKNQVEYSMKPGNMNDLFVGDQFLPLLSLVLCLPQGPETDLLHGMDRIMESLNLLRLLVIRDTEWKRTRGAWMELCKIKDDFLKLLRVCLSMSRSYYLAQVKTMREDRKIQAREARMAETSMVVKSMTVKQEKVSDMPPEIQYQVLQSALVTFDLMESLIFRIEEITEEKEDQQ